MHRRQATARGERVRLTLPRTAPQGDCAMARPTLEELYDRLEIDELLTRYATAIDTKNFDLLDQVFTPDAHLDYTTAGGIAGDFPTVKAWLANVLPHFPQYQHVVCNRNITLDGDTASSIAAFFNP